jgi:hypothetical protein
MKGGSRRPAIPAAESALCSHPCVAVSSAQVFTVVVQLCHATRPSALFIALPNRKALRLTAKNQAREGERIIQGFKKIVRRRAVRTLKE